METLVYGNGQPEGDKEQLTAVLEEISTQMGEIRVLLREILEAVYGIQIGDDVLGQAVNRYNRKMNIAKGGPS